MGRAAAWVGGALVLALAALAALLWGAWRVMVSVPHVLLWMLRVLWLLVMLALVIGGVLYAINHLL